MSQGKRRVVFMGTPQFAVPVLQKIASEYDVVAVYSQPDRPVGRGLEVQAPPVKQEATRLGLPVFQPNKLTLPGEYEKLAELNPDFIVVVAYGQILKRNVLDLPKFGCVNIHASLLPKWRGAAPIQWSLLSGDRRTGVTTMLMAEKLDAGPMLLKRDTEILESDNLSTLHDRLSQMGAELIIPTLKGLENGTIHPEIQDEAQVTFASKLTKEMETLRPDLKSARELDLQVRALNPWPGSSFELDIAGKKERIRVRKAKAHADLSGPVGALFERAGMLCVGCVEGSLELQMVQQEGRKVSEVSPFLNGLKGKGVALPLSLQLGSSQ
jgi:methionyl-tRNA formyltransferase